MNAIVVFGIAVLVLGVLAVLDYIERRGVASDLAEVRQDVHATRRALVRANLVAASDRFSDDGFHTEPLTALLEDAAVDGLDLGDRYAPTMRRGAPICMAVRDGYLCVRPHVAGRHVATQQGVVVRLWNDPADAVTETLAVGR